MKITDIQQLVDLIKQGSYMIVFNYHGHEFHIEPIYNAEHGTSVYLLFGMEKEKTVKTIDEIMEIPFFDGDKISAIFNKIEDFELA